MKLDTPNKRQLIALTLIFIFSGLIKLQAQDQYELTGDWVCKSITEFSDNGETISSKDYSVSGWMPATVPGTVLTTLLNNEKVPDPFYGMNNEKIKDIYETGRDHYTYWFVKDFEEKAGKNEQVWLHLRGVNYSTEIFLNGKKVNKETHYGMFLRQTYNITDLLDSKGKNRLAVIVYPPDPVGNPNGGQGGDGRIAKGVSHQYVAGWDWIQPTRDRNTGIWDKVFIEKTGAVNVKNPHIVTLVPGKRDPKAKEQAPVNIKITAEVENPTSSAISGILKYTLEGKEVSQDVTVAANSTKLVKLADYEMQNPKLWWPNMYGEQNLYDIEISFVQGKKTSDSEKVTFGVREIQKEWNTKTQSAQINVNGQKIFIKGGNWIISDAMLRFTDERYDAEIRYHRDMNLNLIRIWGGALTERPEFYQACDKYGMLVIQDFWMSGDCNGRWFDPMKAEDQWTRRQYPDDHNLFLTSAKDMVKMIRNHASLAMYCGGNEITPPEDILIPLRDEILPELDGTRWFIEYSNSDSMSLNTLGGNGDGPYGIQPISMFWDHQTFPFNSEVGSVGVGDIESLRRFIPEENLTPPTYNDETVDDVWAYHKYIGYGAHVRPYGDAKDAKDFGVKAQLINYDQYRALMEGFSAHMWDWYSGSIIWKTQNPWTAMRGQMYDYYLDPNACLYGLRKGSEPLHIMYNPTSGMVYTVNNSFEALRSIMLKIESIDMKGNKEMLTQVFVGMEPTSSKKILSVKPFLDKIAKEEGVFLNFQLLNTDQEVLSENFYWVPNANGEYTGLNNMAEAKASITAKQTEKGKIAVTLKNDESNPVAFFNRVALIDGTTGKRILPVFYDDNYVSVIAGEEKTVILEFDPELAGKNAKVTVEGWNVPKQTIDIID
ncbi:glycoside hydrolase family 2 protein [Chondrinema litorale]|uniref:glycoside hydrolase family 2 protein n=1 Tax=Chondrinema litorale TaxID=2994555 RepID=UPI002542AA99|nr:glycoside hydrolase family 2 TIM barrel-domain containing protein [Chondrinema litorale]UZR97530.1 glycosyl hydrolase [Chondrinema litorale]